MATDERPEGKLPPGMGAALEAQKRREEQIAEALAMLIDALASECIQPHVCGSDSPGHKAQCQCVRTAITNGVAAIQDLEPSLRNEESLERICQVLIDRRNRRIDDGAPHDAYGGIAEALGTHGGRPS